MAFQQGFPYIAHMAVAGMGLCGQIGDAPCSIRVAQQNSALLKMERSARVSVLGLSATARSM